MYADQPEDFNHKILHVCETINWRVMMKVLFFWNYPNMAFCRAVFLHMHMLSCMSANYLCWVLNWDRRVWKPLGLKTRCLFCTILNLFFFFFMTHNYDYIMMWNMKKCDCLNVYFFEKSVYLWFGYKYIIIIL